METFNDPRRELSDAQYSVSLKQTPASLARLQAALENYVREVQIARLTMAESKDGVLAGQVID